MNLTDPQQLSSALQALQSGNNTIIKNSEKALKAFGKNPECINALLVQIQSNSDEHCRLQAALLLKKNIGKHYKKYSPENRVFLKNGLLGILTNDPVNSVRTAIAGTVSTLAKTVYETEAEGWPDLFTLLAQLSLDPDERKRSMSYNLAGQLSEYIHKYLLPFSGQMAQLYARGLSDSSQEVIKEAMRAVAG